MNLVQTLQIVGIMIVISALCMLLTQIMYLRRTHLIRKRQKHQSSYQQVAPSQNTEINYAHPPKPMGVTSIYRKPKDTK